MRRRIFMVVIFLLAGAIVNVAVAWWCGGLLLVNYPVAIHDEKRADPDLVQPLWDRHRESGWPVAPDGMFIFELGGGFTLLTAESGSTRVGGPPTVIVSEGRCGWPMRSMKYDFWGTSVAGGHYGSTLPAVGVMRPLLRDPGFFVPVGVIPVGFVIDSIVYAVVLWLLICGAFVLRRVIRVRRGLCPACAYPRGEAAVCSECGKALAKRATVIADGELGDS